MNLAQTYAAVPVARWRGGRPRQLGTILFFGLLPLASVIPGRLELSTDVHGVPLRLLDLLLVALTGILMLLRLLQGRLPRSKDAYVPALFSGLLVYAALSLVGWSSATEPDTSAMAWTLVLSAASLWSAYLVVRSQRRRLPRFLSNLTAFLAVIAAGYSAQSFFNLGFRSADSATPDPTFGIDRVKGPLFAASLGGLILLPAIAFALQEVIRGRRRIWNGLALAALLIACLGTGSRATLLGLGVTLALATASLRSTRQRVAFASALLIVGGLATGLVFSRVSTGRLVVLEDPERSLTITTGLDAIRQASIWEGIRGQGYASYWRWYLVDARGEGNINFDGFFVDRPAGVTLYHPHSTPLLLAVELGAPGVAAGVALAWAIWRARRRGARRRLPTTLFAGLAGTAVTLATDLVLFKGPVLNLIWWTYVFGAMALVRPVSPGRRRRPDAVSTVGVAGLHGRLPSFSTHNPGSTR